MQETQQTPEVIEDVKVELSEEPKTNPPEVQAAMFIRGALPQVRQLIRSSKFTGVQAKAVLEHILESPLEDEAPEFTTVTASQIFQVGTMIQNSKFILFQVALKDSELTDKVEKEMQEEANSKSQEKKEESNGN